MMSCCQDPKLPCQALNCNSAGNYQLECSHIACDSCILANYSVRSFDHSRGLCLSPTCAKMISLDCIIDLSKTNGETIKTTLNKEAFKIEYGISVGRIRQIRKDTLKMHLKIVCCIAAFTIAATVSGVYLGQ